jgi:ribosome-binding ATPase YchF (GTP1/OBG family)
MPISFKNKKIRNKINNKTKKKREKNKIKKNKENKEDMNIICKKSESTYEPFEDKIEELFKKKNMNILSTSYNLEKEIISELKKAVNTKNIRPNQDFYSYINDRWIKEYELTNQQHYIVQVDDFRIVQDKVYRELIQIIEEYIKNPSTKNSKKAKCIKNAYLSFKKQNTIEQTRETSKKVLEYINELFNDKNNVWENLTIFP